MTTNPLIFCIDSRIENSTSLYSRFQLGPIPKGHGLTVGNALRRILLSELKTTAILAARLQLHNGAFVPHEYSSLTGVQESTLDILLNLRELVFITKNLQAEPIIGSFKLKGPKRITAGDLKLPRNIQIVDPDQYICTINDDIELGVQVLLGVGKVGTSFVNVTPQKETFTQKGNYFRLDPSFQAIKQINYKIEENFLQMDGQITEASEQIILEVSTNGSIHPFQALKTGLMELQTLFNTISLTSFYTLRSTKSRSETNMVNEPVNKMYLTKPLRKRICSFDIANLQLNLSTFIQLKKENFQTIGDLVITDITQLRTQLTKDAFDEVVHLLQQLGLEKSTLSLNNSIIEGDINE